jgi:hypothetical protein
VQHARFLAEVLAPGAERLGRLALPRHALHAIGDLDADHAQRLGRVPQRVATIREHLRIAVLD